MYHNFLTADEADQLILQAAPHLKRSTVVGDGKDKNKVDNIRTSYGTFLTRLSSPTVEVLEKKLANWTQLPIIHQEDIQVRASQRISPWQAAQRAQAATALVLCNCKQCQHFTWQDQV